MSYAYNYPLLARAVLLTFLPIAAIGADVQDKSQAEQQVKSAPCLNETIETALQHKINSSQRDLGWQVFEEDGFYVVERSVLVSKSMQLRYRWKIDLQGTIQPGSDRAEKLCIAEE